MGRCKVDYETGGLIPLGEVMTGASDTQSGMEGLVPAPAAHYQYRLLGGDGTWQKGNFVGTRKEWNNLTKEEKLQFKTADIYKKQCTITYKANNGIDSDLVVMAIEGKYTTKQNPFTAPADMLLWYWNTESDGSGINYNPNEEIYIDDDLTLWAVWDWVALKFSSDDDFTLSVLNPGWDGTIEYTLNNGNNWSTWNGSELSGTTTQPIYIRGTGNTVITGSSGPNHKWIFTGKYCTGNIETLLDYQTVINNQHPTMENFCYAAMFSGCTSLTSAPELLATTLVSYCYDSMFYGCTSLTTLPNLPATTLADTCYRNMFNGCTSLIVTPELPAITLAENCYNYMFANCISLTTAPKLPATTLANQCYTYMFYDCISLKFSTTPTEEYKYPYRIPTSGTGTTAVGAFSSMFDGTGGTFTGNPTINTTYYTDHEPV